jgi:hypothetical protein
MSQNTLKIYEQVNYICCPITNSMKQLLEDDSRSADHEISLSPSKILKSDPSQSQSNATSGYFNIHFNIILSSTPWCSKSFFPSGFRLKFCTNYSFAPCVLHASSISFSLI